jgi:RNA polymerase sigma-70 factor (ECF subfamily)
MKPITTPPSEQPAPEVTGLLIAWRNGDERAINQLIPIVYEELRRVAHRHMRGERDGHTLQTTALVNEAYLRLVKSCREVEWQNRAQFFAIAAGQMRRVLMDIARAHHRQRRGGGAQRAELDETCIAGPDSSLSLEELLALDEALARLGRIYPRKAQVVELKFFGGLSDAEAAAALKINPESVKKDWQKAKLFLRRELGEKGGEHHAD